MRTIINYTDNAGIKTSIEFNNLEDAYSFTFDFDVHSVEVVGSGVYTKDEFQTAFSNNEF